MKQIEQSGDCRNWIYGIKKMEHISHWTGVCVPSFYIYKYINYLLDQLPQLENLSDANVLEKYLPWSTELPDDVLNFEGAYEDLKIEDVD